MDTKKEEVMFQHYTSTRAAMNLITETGRKVKFVNHEYLTSEEEIIDYLDKEIRLGLRAISKGKLMSRSEADPMEALKRKHIAEYLEAEAKELADKAMGKSKDMGTTGSKPEIAPASTKDVAK